jgi:hypothetical protein
LRATRPGRRLLEKVSKGEWSPRRCAGQHNKAPRRRQRPGPQTQEVPLPCRTQHPKTSPPAPSSATSGRRPVTEASRSERPRAVAPTTSSRRVATSRRHDRAGSARAPGRPPRTFGTRPARRRPTEDQGAELFEQWFEGKTRLAPWTRKSYRDAIDLVLIPAFGSWQVAVIDADAVAKLIRGLEADGLHSLDAKRPRRPLSASSISNYTGPLAGALALAVRRGVIASNPMSALTSDERPRRVDAPPARGKGPGRSRPITRAGRWTSSARRS